MVNERWHSGRHADACSTASGSDDESACDSCDGSVGLRDVEVAQSSHDTTQGWAGCGRDRQCSTL